MAWILLVIGIFFSVGATLSLRASAGFSRFFFIIVTIAGYVIAIIFFGFSVRSLPLGLVYAIWSSTGIVLVAICSYFIFGDKFSPTSIFGIVLILIGVVIVRLAIVTA